MHVYFFRIAIEKILMKKLILSFFMVFSPFIVCASSFSNDLESYANDFAECLKTQSTLEGWTILKEWEKEHPENFASIKGLSSVLHLLEGDLFLSISLMKEAQEELYNEGFPPNLLNMINELYTHLEKDSILFSYENDNQTITLCGGTQPRGVKFKFWIGVAQITGGCLLMPISPVAGVALIGAGAGCVIDATASALDNKEQWENELNQRQRIGPENLPPSPPNQLPPPPSQRSSYRSKEASSTLLVEDERSIYSQLLI